MTRIEAIRQRAGVLWESYLRDDHYNHQDIAVELADFVPELVTLWDTRETALRALVEQMRLLVEEARDAAYDGLSWERPFFREHPSFLPRLEQACESLSRLLEQEP